jgi:transcriptional regulator with XRE-family HTH domain
MGSEGGPAMRILGTRVKTLREARGLTQGQLAYKASTTSAQISRIENNERPGAQAILIGRIAEALGTTADYLLGRTADPMPPHLVDEAFEPQDQIEIQRLVEQMARLPEERRGRLIRAFRQILETEEVIEEVNEERVLPEST